MGSDGVEGMRAIKAAGGVTLAQDAKSSVVYGMNQLAVEKGYIDKVLPLTEIAAGLLKLADGR
jgi:two-component system chemotaxis response regulator CheB